MARYILLTRDDLMKIDTRLTIREVRNAVETYSPDFMHGLPKKKYVKFLDLFDPSIQFPEVEGIQGIAYCMFKYLLGLENSKPWIQFLEEALDELISDSEQKTDGV